MLRLNLRNRIIIIYLLCILVPVLLVNGILYFYLSEDLFVYENDNRVASTNRFAMKAVNEINSYGDVISRMPFDLGLIQLLESDFTLEPYRYDQLVQTSQKFLTDYVEAIEFYGSNAGPGKALYQPLDRTIQDEGWYQRLSRSESKRVLVTRTEAIEGQTTGVKKLQYYGLQNYSASDVRVFSMVVGTQFLDDLAREEYSEGLYLLVNQFNDIVYASNDTFSGYDAYDSLLLFQKDENFYYSEVVYNDMDLISGWRIIGIFPKEDIYDKLIERRNMIIIVVFLGLLVATLLISSLSSSINRRFSKLNQQVENIKAGDFSKVAIKTPKDELGHFIGEFHDMTDQMNVLINEVYEKELEKKNLVIEKQQAELNALQSQVNPHFLYNVMNTIRMKSVVKGEKETAAILKYVGAMFRRVINWQEDMITLQEELTFVEEYLKVQKYRFEDRLTYTLEVDDLSMQALIPKMTLQTFIENASTHGLEGQVAGCHVSLKVECDRDRVSIHVKDNGKGMTEIELDALRSYIGSKTKLGESVGLKNVYQRLWIYFNQGMTFDLNSELGEGTEIALEIPYVTKEASDENNDYR